MAKAIGIDIGSRAAKVAVVDGGPGSAKLLRFASVEHELDDSGRLTPAAALDSLRKALSQAKGPRNAASYALPAERCVVREISVPFSQEDQIRKVVKFEFEPHLHSAAIEDVVLDYVVTGDQTVGKRLLIFAALKERLSGQLDQLREVGVDPLHVDSDVTALFNVASAAGAFEEHPNALVIDIGARTTKALFVADGQLKVARSIRLGSESVRRKTAAGLDGDREAAERALEHATGVEALAEAPDLDANTTDIVISVEEVEAAIASAQQTTFMDRVLRETQRTLPLLAADAGPTCVYLTGGGSMHPNARQRIAGQFGCEVRDLPVLDAVSHDLPPSEAASIAAGGAVAIGTALKVLGNDAGGIDFRQEEFRFARKFDQLKSPLAWGVTFAFLAVFLLFLAEFMKIQRADRELRDLKAAVKEQLDEDVLNLYRDTISDHKPLSEPTRESAYFRGYEANLKTIQNHMKNELGLATEVPPVLSSLRVWNEVLDSFASVRQRNSNPKVEYLFIEQEKYDQDKAELKVVVESYEAGQLLIEQLKKRPLFVSVEPISPRAREDGRIELEIKIEYDEFWNELDEDGGEDSAALPSDPVRTATAEPADGEEGGGR